MHLTSKSYMLSSIIQIFGHPYLVAYFDPFIGSSVAIVDKGPVILPILFFGVYAIFRIATQNGND